MCEAMALASLFAFGLGSFPPVDYMCSTVTNAVEYAGLLSRCRRLGGPTWVHWRGSPSTLNGLLAT